MSGHRKRSMICHRRKRRFPRSLAAGVNLPSCGIHTRNGGFSLLPEGGGRAIQSKRADGDGGQGGARSPLYKSSRSDEGFSTQQVPRSTRWTVLFVRRNAPTTTTPSRRPQSSSERRPRRPRTRSPRSRSLRAGSSSGGHGGPVHTYFSDSD